MAKNILIDAEEGSPCPSAKQMTCPECDSEALVIVPQDTQIVESEADADGKVWGNCRTCENGFLAYYQTV
jgi:hypothetical protein